MRSWIALILVLLVGFAGVSHGQKVILKHPRPFICTPPNCSYPPPTVSISPGTETSTSSSVAVTITLCDTLTLANDTVYLNGRVITSGFTSTSGRSAGCNVKTTLTGPVNLPLGANILSAVVSGTAASGNGWQQASASVTYTYTPPSHSATVTVSPTSVVGTPGVNTTTTFTVTNTGNVTDSLWFGAHPDTVPCSGPVFSWCGAWSIGGVILAPGHDTTVSTQWQPGPAGSNGVVRLTATENNGVAVSAIQKVTTAANPGLDVVDANPGVSFNRANCLTIAMGPHAASECTDLRLTHALPAVRTYNKVRIPTLLYNWRFAQTAVNIGGLLTVAASSRKLDSVTAKLYVWPHGGSRGGVGASGGWPSIDWDSAAMTTTRRIELSWPGDSIEQNGLYDYVLNTTRYYKIPGQGDSMPQDSATGHFVNVTRTKSPYGVGWWVVGLEQLFFYGPGNDTIAWIGGDGSTNLYVDSAGVWRPTTYVAGRDSIIWVASSGSYERAAPHGWRIYFTTDGQMWWRINSVGEPTYFHHTGSTPQVDYIAPPIPGAVGSDTTVNYSFYYDASGTLDSVRAPGSPKRRTVKFVDSLAVSGASKTIMRIVDPDGDTVKFTLDPNAALRYISRIDKRGTTTVFGYGLDAEGFGYSDTQMQDSTVSDIRRTLYMSSNYGLSAPWIARNVTHAMWPESAYVSYHGPRSNSTHGADLKDTTKIWVDRWWQPTMIEDANGNFTYIRRDNPTYPSRVTETQDALGRVQIATLNRRGYDSTEMDLGVYLKAYPKTVHLYLDSLDLDTLVTLPLGETIHKSYDLSGNLLYSQLGPTSTHRTTFTYAGTCGGLPSDYAEPSTNADSLLYDATLCNLSAERSPNHFWTSYTTDSVGRATLIASAIEVGDTLHPNDTLPRLQVHQYYDAMDRDTATLTVGPPLNSVGQQTAGVHTVYDANGNPMAVTRTSSPADAGIASLRTATVYDRANRPTVDTAVNGATTIRRYDAAGNIDTLITKRRYTIVNQYDALNRLISKIVPSFMADSMRSGILVEKINFHYHTDTSSLDYGPWAIRQYGGQLVHGDTVTFSYDADSRVVEADNANARISRAYLLNGLLKSETQRISTVVDSGTKGSFTEHVYQLGYHYDRDGRRDSLYFPQQIGSWSINGSVGTIQSYAYNDTTGWLDTIVDVGGGKFTLAYTPRGDLNIVTTPSAIGLSEVRTVDGDGNMIADSVGGAALFREAHFTYDARGKQLVGANAVGLKDTVWAWYSGLGQLVRDSSEDTVRGSAGSNYEHFKYDAFGNRAHDTTSNATYNAWGGTLGNVNTSLSSSRKSWTYNATTGWLTQSVDTSSAVFSQEKFTYDTAGNTQFYTQGFDSSKVPPLVVQDRASFYDTEDRLVEADYRELYGPQSSTSRFLERVDEQYRYDAFGRRILVIANRFCGSKGTIGYPDYTDCGRRFVRRTIWDGQQELVEIQQPDSIRSFDPDSQVPAVTELDSGVVQLGSNAAWDNNLFFGQVLYTHGLVTDQPLSVIRLNYADDSSGGYYVYPPLYVVPFWNAQGRNDFLTAVQVAGGVPGGNGCSTVAGIQRCPVANTQPGFAAYNNITVSSKLSWMGSILEDKIDAAWTQYRRARVYDPITGRFTQPDPLGLAGGINDYGFAAGDPVNYSDPSGLGPCQKGNAVQNGNCAPDPCPPDVKKFLETPGIKRARRDVWAGSTRSLDYAQQNGQKCWEYGEWANPGWNFSSSEYTDRHWWGVNPAPEPEGATSFVHSHCADRAHQSPSTSGPFGAAAGAQQHGGDVAGAEETHTIDVVQGEDSTFLIVPGTTEGTQVFSCKMAPPKS